MTATLTERLGQQAAGSAVATRGATVADLLERQKEQIARALPKHLTADRFTRIALTELRRNPKLMACSPASLLGALMQAAQLGIEPGPMGQAYLVPYGGEVTFIVGYRGYIDLFRRSGEMSVIVAREACEHDAFELEYRNAEDHLVHRPNLTGDRGKPFAYYGIARFRDGGQLVHVMTLAEIEKRRDRSKAKGSGPWVTDYDAMARKTVIRAMSPYLPLSADIATALESDEGVYEWSAAGATRVDAPDDELATDEASPEVVGADRGDAGDAAGSGSPDPAAPGEDKPPDEWSLSALKGWLREREQPQTGDRDALVARVYQTMSADAVAESTE